MMKWRRNALLDDEQPEADERQAGRPVPVRKKTKKKQTRQLIKLLNDTTVDRHAAADLGVVI